MSRVDFTVDEVQRLDDGYGSYGELRAVEVEDREGEDDESDCDEYG